MLTCSCIFLNDRSSSSGRRILIRKCHRSLYTVDRMQITRWSLPSFFACRFEMWTTKFLEWKLLPAMFTGTCFRKLDRDLYRMMSLYIYISIYRWIYVCISIYIYIYTQMHIYIYMNCTCRSEPLTRTGGWYGHVIRMLHPIGQYISRTDGRAVLSIGISPMLKRVVNREKRK